MNKKWIIVCADLFRGVLYTLMGLTVIWNVFPLWLIYPLAILAGTSGAFFGPAIGAALPEMISTENLTKANSARSMSSTLTELIGQPLGATLYAVLSAPVMFLLNGLSFLYAGITQLFMKIPHRANAGEKKHILHDMADGFRYVMGNKGVKLMIFTGMCLNFFAVIGITLFTPMFQNDPDLGVQRYGFAMGVMMVGSIMGMIVLQVLKLKPEQRSLVFRVAMAAMVVMMIAFMLVQNYILMLVLVFFAGLFNATVNVMLQTVMQITVPAEFRGKVFGIFTTVLEGLMPVAMAVSGVVAQFAGVRPTILVAFILMGLFTLPSIVSRSFKNFINTKPAETPAEPVPAALPEEA